MEQEGVAVPGGRHFGVTPSFAGLMAIVNQYTHSTNGNPNAKFYALAAQVPVGLPRCHQRLERRALRGRLAQLLRRRRPAATSAR